MKNMLPLLVAATSAMSMCFCFKSGPETRSISQQDKAICLSFDKLSIYNPNRTWKLEHLEVPSYLDEYIFKKDGENFTGTVCEYDGDGNLTVSGSIRNGKVNGLWKLYTTFGSYQEILFSRKNGQTRWESLKRYNNELLNFHRVPLNDSIYIDSIFHMVPYYLSDVMWLKRPKNVLLQPYFKLKRFNEKGFLTQIYLKDSVNIRWVERSTTGFVDSCMLDKGYCVEIVRGKPERCFVLKEGYSSPVVYMGRNSNGIYYKEGLFIKYDVYGKTDSVFVDVNREHY